MSSYRFDFGDGSTPVTSSMSTASHTFTAAGTYTVTLTVTDNRGATASAMLQVVVSPFVRLPTIVLPAVDDVGQACAIATPGSRVFLAWTSARHPGIFFGERINGTLQVEVVDTLGFNTGGLISQHVSMQVEPNGTPHLVYVRENTVVYATKSGATWLRERVDTPSVPLDLSSNNPSIALVDSSPVVLFTTDTTSSTARPAIASRTAANTWTRTVVWAVSEIRVNAGRRRVERGVEHHRRRGRGSARQSGGVEHGDRAEEFEGVRGRLKSC